MRSRASGGARIATAQSRQQSRVPGHASSSLSPSSVSGSKFLSSGRADWIRDSEGAGELNKDRFFRCWFELADLWSKQSPAIRSHVTAPPSQLCCL